MIKRTCKECGKEFTLSDSEIKFYKDKNLELPKRCSECRKNKNKKEEVYTSSQKTGTNSSKKFRNAIIAAVIIIASFFGYQFNFGSNTADNNVNENHVEQSSSLTFRNDKLLDEHFKKHGSEFNYKTKEQYVNGAIAVVNSSSSKHKTEGSDGDDIYYDEKNNEIVFVSTDGYIRTYFKPSDGINYYNRQ